jgi:hypothetical protein
MTIKKILITPSLAKTFLEANVCNRKIKEKVVIKYASDMQKDLWIEDTFEPIKFSKTGKLLDGQHRLLAVVKSNKAVNFHIVDNLKEEIFSVLDSGTKRNASDVFGISGIKNATLIPAIISFYNRIKSGSNGNNHDNQTNIHLIECYNEREEFWQMTSNKTQSWYDSFSRILQPSIIGGMYAHFYDLNSIQAEDFFNQLCNQKNPTNSTILNLRKKLFDDKIATRKMGIQIKNALIIKTWNYYRNNEIIKVLKYDIEREKFPKAI